MKPFVFSGDGHVMEPRDLFIEQMPKSLREYGIHSKKDGGWVSTYAGDKMIHRMPVNTSSAKTDDEKANFGRPNIMGARDINARLLDMVQEGIDGEIVFPTVGMLTYLLENRDAEVASVQLYNDWIDGFLSGHLDKFVRCALLPVRDFDDTVAEMERLAAKGFTSAMLPSQIPMGVPNYNDGGWDKVFDAAQRLNIVFALHTATGRVDVRPERGPGGAIINYTTQMCDAINAIMYMVAGGILDRFPKVQVFVVESGASWLAGLAERMDEVNFAHRAFVKPQLSLRPSEIIQRQINISFQTDRACIISRSVTGTKGLIWGADYPHAEGTFPFTRKILGELFDGIEISEQEKAQIVGLNGARLFRLPNPAILTQAA